MQRPLNPGELTKPVRVWCSSTSLRIAWYQAEPLSESVTIFYKKSGSLVSGANTAALCAHSILSPATVHMLVAGLHTDGLQVAASMRPCRSERTSAAKVGDARVLCTPTLRAVWHRDCPAHGLSAGP